MLWSAMSLGSFVGIVLQTAAEVGKLSTGGNIEWFYAQNVTRMPRKICSYTAKGSTKRTCTGNIRRVIRLSRN
jgi:hypothetical protein